MAFDSLEKTPEAPKVVHRELREWLTQMYVMLHEAPPEEWGRRLYLASLRMEYRFTDVAKTKEYEGLIDYIRQYTSTLREEVRIAVRAPDRESTEGVLAAIDRSIHHIAESVMMMEGESDREDEAPHRVTLEQLCTLPGVSRVYDETKGLWMLHVQHGKKEAYLPLPSSSSILHKGGTPRVLLKLWMEADSSLIEAELPPNDIDVLVTGPREAWQEEALRMGADLEGIEQVDGFDTMRELFVSRDVDLNQCFLGAEGLVFSERAARAAETGAIEVSARNRTLYGSEVMVVEGRRLLKARGMMRILKFIAEGKAASAEMSLLNTRVDLGVYWLLLARKFMKKSNGPELLLRLQAVVEQMRPDRPTRSVIEILDEVHTQFPFLNFADTALSAVDVARWLAKKAIKEVDRHFRSHGHVPRPPLFSEEELALEGTVRLSLDEFTPDPEEMRELREAWPAFLLRCHARTEQETARRAGAPPTLFFDEEERV